MRLSDSAYVSLLSIESTHSLQIKENTEHNACRVLNYTEIPKFLQATTSWKISKYFQRSNDANILDTFSVVASQQQRHVN
jgi:hypothetical protein